MSRSRLSSKKVLSSVVMIVFFVVAASAVHAYDWTVYFPADVEYTKCEILAYGSGGAYKNFLINRGEAFSSHFDGNISYIDGRCNMSSWGSTYFTRIQGRTCDGVDYQSSVAGGKSCAQNVKVKICKKGSGVGEWSHGFCPN